MLTIYAPDISPRVAYVCQVLFEYVLEVEYRLIDREDVYKTAGGLQVHYTQDDSLPGYQIVPDGWLSARGLREVEPAVTEWEGLPALFPVKGGIGFDVFSAAFFLLSRYEEYQPYRGDAFGRFPAEDSYAYRHGFLHRPVIDEWMHKLNRKWLIRDVTGAKGDYRYAFVSTIDVDSAFAYRYKGLMRTLGGFAKDAVGGDIRNARRRSMALAGRVPDPYNTYDRFHQWHQEYDVRAIYFFLLADYGYNDKGVSHRSRHLQQLIREVGDYYELGIHPGYQSNFDAKRLEVEVHRMARISRRDIVRSRQHFLILNLPETFRRLIALGVREDHTMGFASQPGFRAGTSKPFPFYDLERESTTPLMLHPFAVMDATLNRYLSLSPSEALERIRELALKVKSVEGTFTILWHNESLSEENIWKGWRDVYPKTLALAKELENKEKGASENPQRS